MEDPGSGFRPPLLAGRYVVQSRLGRGGTSGVYLVFDLKLRAWRAAKVMHPTAASDPELRERFAREAVIMARLDHPNVVRVVDVATEVALPHLVMEYMEGGTVVDYLKAHGAMHPVLAARVAADLCQGLSALHQIGGVHRDVKPHNLLVDRAGRCKLTDFGIARVGAPGENDPGLDDLDGHLTQVGTVMGTQSYMAPEQRVDASRVDQRADVYGVGATLFTLVTAKPSTDLAFAAPDDPCFLGIPPALRDLIVRLAAYRPADRPGDVKDVARALEELPLPPLPRGTPPLVGSVPELPARPLSRLDPQAVRGMSELIAGGAVRATWDPAAHTTGGSLRPREHRPQPKRREAAWSTPMALRREEVTEVFSDTPRPEEQTIVRRDEAELDAQLSEAPKRSTDIRPSARIELTASDYEDEKPERRWLPDIRVVVVAMGLILTAAVLLGAVGSILVARGARQVGEAERGVLGAQDRLWVLIDHHQPVVSDLGRLGVDRGELEEALVAFQTAAPDDKPPRAEAYLDLLERRWKAVKADPAVVPATKGAMADLEEGWAAYQQAVGAWHAAAGSATGRLAIGLGLAAPPPAR